MATEREMKEKQEEQYFDNCLSQEYLKNGKAAELSKYLEMASFRLKSGMSADEIDAVHERARQAYAAQNK